MVCNYSYNLFSYIYNVSIVFKSDCGIHDGINVMKKITISTLYLLIVLFYIESLNLIE